MRLQYGPVCNRAGCGPHRKFIGSTATKAVTHGLEVRSDNWLGKLFDLAGRSGGSLLVFCISAKINIGGGVVCCSDLTGWNSNRWSFAECAVSNSAHQAIGASLAFSLKSKQGIPG